MKIGIYDPYLDALGGGEKYMLTAASTLQKNHHVTLFWDTPEDIQKAEERFKLSLQDVTLQKNIFSKDVSLFERLIATQAYDVIFFLSDGSIPLVAAKKLYLHFQFPVNWVHEDSFLSRFKLSRVSQIICNSAYTKQYVDKKFHLESEVVYPPIAFTHDRKSQKKTNTILTVGRYNSRGEEDDFKKLQFMLGTFRKLHETEKIKDWEFTMIVSFLPTEEEHVARLEEKAKGYPVKIIKNASYTVLHEAYEAAKIYWHAAGFGEDLTNHPERAEHFGIATVEAMAKGCVPVVIQAGGLSEIVVHNENGLLWKTEEELRHETLSLIENNTKLEALAKKAQDIKHTFNEERFMREIESLFV